MGAAIALPKWMNVVDVTENLAGLGGEGFPAEVLQMVCRYQPIVDVGHAGFDKAVRLKLTAALGDLDGPDGPGPVIEVLEEMTVDGAKVGEVKVAGWAALAQALGYEFPLDVVKMRRISDCQLVLKNLAIRIEVGIGAHSAACR